ncbi:MAG: transglutaminase-like cysteine peptidase [Candidatus Sedimenticola sp. (ex Thyasira tokunagai)]
MKCLKSASSLATLSVLLLILILISGCSTAPKAPKTTPAEQRIADWQQLIQTKKTAITFEKLTSVNNFFNKLVFVDDIDHWGEQDYWATPLETLQTNGGDCEDFTIAKFFTLKEMDVPEQAMRLMYVKSLTLNQPHMVLTYHQGYEMDPLVLDNLVNAIVPASQRQDLIPVYSFNIEGLWVVKQRSKGIYAGNGDKNGLWRAFLKRMGIEGGNTR